MLSLRKSGACSSASPSESLDAGPVAPSLRTPAKLKVPFDVVVRFQEQQQRERPSRRLAPPGVSGRHDEEENLSSVVPLDLARACQQSSACVPVGVVR